VREIFISGHVSCTNTNKICVSGSSSTAAAPFFLRMDLLLINVIRLIFIKIVLIYRILHLIKVQADREQRRD